MEHFNKIFITLNNCRRKIDSPFPQEKELAIILYDYLVEYQLKYLIRHEVMNDISWSRIANQESRFTKKEAIPSQYFENLRKLSVRCDYIGESTSSLLAILHSFRNMVRHEGFLGEDLINLAIDGYKYFFSQSRTIFGPEPKGLFCVGGTSHATEGYEIFGGQNTNGLNSSRSQILGEQHVKFDWDKAFDDLLSPIPSKNDITASFISQLEKLYKRFSESLEQLNETVLNVDINYVLQSWHYPIKFSLPSNTKIDEKFVWSLLETTKIFDENYEFFMLETDTRTKLEDLEKFRKKYNIGSYWSIEKFDKVLEEVKELRIDTNKCVFKYFFDNYFYVSKLSYACASLLDAIQHVYERD